MNLLLWKKKINKKKKIKINFVYGVIQGNEEKNKKSSYIDAFTIERTTEWIWKWKLNVNFVHDVIQGNEKKRKKLYALINLLLCKNER